MQTFLPYECFSGTARCLDWQRLGKQRIEARQILEVSLKVLKGEDVRGWVNHPARLMWAKHLFALCEYGKVICDEWIARGYQDQQRPLFESYQRGLRNTGMPDWLGDKSFHIAHRSNLLRKGKEAWVNRQDDSALKRYRALWPDLPDDLPYVWPVQR